MRVKVARPAPRSGTWTMQFNGTTLGKDADPPSRSTVISSLALLQITARPAQRDPVLFSGIPTRDEQGVLTHSALLAVAEIINAFHSRPAVQPDNIATNLIGARVGAEFAKRVDDDHRRIPGNQVPEIPANVRGVERGVVRLLRVEDQAGAQRIADHAVESGKDQHLREDARKLFHLRIHHIAG